LDVPTFGLLDLLSFEAEFAPNPWASTSHGPYGNGTALPFVDEFAETFPNGITNVSEDNWKWTFLVEKRINALCKAQLQIANDHLRTVDVFGALDFYDYLRDPAHWYWVMRLEFAI
jgi:hypothetical protein